VWSQKPRPPLFRGKWVMREARSGRAAKVFEVLVMHWRRSVVQD
jgi:hypothetical protein